MFYRGGQLAQNHVCHLAGEKIFCIPIRMPSNSKWRDLKVWYVYIVDCSDASLYAGITTDLDRRVREHNHESVGARYTRAKRPVTLRYSEEAENRSLASKREIAIKKMTRKQKLQLIRDGRAPE